MVVRVSVVFLRDGMADGRLPLSPPICHHKRGAHCISLGQEKIKNSKSFAVSAECVSLRHHRKFEKIVS